MKYTTTVTWTKNQAKNERKKKSESEREHTIGNKDLIQQMFDLTLPHIHYTLYVCIYLCQSHYCYCTVIVWVFKLFCMPQCIPFFNWREKKKYCFGKSKEEWIKAKWSVKEKKVQFISCEIFQPLLYRSVYKHFIWLLFTLNFLW